MTGQHKLPREERGRGGVGESIPNLGAAHGKALTRGCGSRWGREMLAHWSRNRRITPMEGPERRTGARSWLRSLCPGKAVGSGDTWMTPQGRATVVEWEIGGAGPGRAQ